MHSLSNQRQLMKTQKPLSTIDEARSFVSNYFKENEETLWIDESLNDPIGMNMAIICDGILAAGYRPNGFEQKEGFRIYKYVKEE